MKNDGPYSPAAWRRWENSQKPDTVPGAVRDGWLTPQLPQRQDSLEDQLRDVRVIATKMGCCDAADYLTKVLESPRVSPATPTTNKEQSI